MAKVGFWLQGARGKLAGSSLKGQPGGATVMAKINATPANPNTAAQQGVRSSFKLISQLASSLADIIAIPREGAKSSRNIFTSINYPLVYANEAGAGAVLEDIQLTKSNIPLPHLMVVRTEQETYVKLAESVKGKVDRVVYIVLEKRNGGLSKIAETIKEDVNNNDGKFQALFNNVTITQDIVVYAYGIKLETEAARTKYANMNISTADEIAQVIINRTFSSSEASVTQTTGIEIASGVDESGTEPHKLSLNRGGLKGTVSGGGYYAAGATVTLQFTPADSKQHFTAFAEEDENHGFTTISNNNPATYTMPSKDVKIVVRGYTTNS